LNEKEVLLSNYKHTIRRAVARDGPAWLALIDALAEYEKLAPPSSTAKKRLLRDAFGQRPRFDVFLARDGDKIVGYAITLETYSSFLALPTLFLEDIFVLSEYRRRGFGTDLFKFCVREAYRRGCGRMEWMVLDWNRLALNFYKRLGSKRLNEWLPFRLNRSQMKQILK
jgi:ribosomal protein S18 acetylase RimI-like enzyme